MTYQFKKIGLWGRMTQAKVADPALQISMHLLKQGLEVFASLPADGHGQLRHVTHVDEAELADDIDVLLAVGGDGNLLRAARRVAGQNVPLLGINLGRLGFLTDISPEHMLEAIDAILGGDYLAEERQMLEGQILSERQPSEAMFALNDIVLQKGDSPHMLDLVTTVDDSYVTTHGGDGLIVATTTGSTAYALSCGGPIIQPNVDALVMVPICPHTLSDRPLVLQSSCTIEIRNESGSGNPAQIAYDGEELARLDEDETLRIRAARETVTLLHPTDYNYYELLRSKLNWGRASRSGKNATDS